MHERIKKLRKALDLTQTEFANRIGSVQNTITGYETGRRIPSNQVIALICREFRVNEEWLRTGNGEMFVPAPSGSLEALAREYGLSNGVYLLIRRFLALKPEMQEAFVDFAVKYAGDLAAENTSPAADQAAPPVPDIAAELAELKRQNQILAAKVAAIEEEDAIEAGPSPSVSAGSFSPGQKAKE